MTAEEENPSQLILKCVQDGRVDVLRSILAEIGSRKDFHEIVDTPMIDTGTALHVASHYGDADSVRTLLSSGVNPCVQNDNGRTALQLAQNQEIQHAFHHELLQAVAHSKLGRVCQLLSAGVSIDAVDSPQTRNTPLHWAASFGNDDIIKVLCEGGASLNAVNHLGETPLHDAVKRGDVALVRRLLQYGADPAIKTGKGIDCYEMAAKNAEILQCLSRHSVQQRVQQEETADSENDRASLLSAERTPLMESMLKQQRVDRLLLSGDQMKPQSWTEFLWPQPKSIVIDSSGQKFTVPLDRKLRIYFHPSSEVDPKEIMQIWIMYSPLLQSRQVSLEWHEYNKIHDGQVRDGAITCGVFGDIFDKKECFTLIIEEKGIQIWASDLAGMRCALSTFTQIIRAQPLVIEDGKTEADWTVPCLTVRDGPDTKIRAVFIDFTGCRIFSTDTLLQIASRLSYCKANHLFIHFEVRATDRFAIPYTGQNIFHLQRACNDLHMELVPSLDLNSSYIDIQSAADIIQKFLDSFPNIKSVHFGSNLTEVILNNRHLFDLAKRYVSLIFISVENGCQIPSNPLPPYCILCVSGTYPMQQQDLLKSVHNLCLKFSTSDVGYFCQAPESMVKNAILAEKLSERFPVIGTMVCDLSTGCEIMPQSLVYLPEIAILGVSWNRTTDMKRFCFLLPQIAAEQILMDRKMTPLFEQLLTLGYVEHEITKLGHGLIGIKNGPSSPPQKIKASLSVFVQMFLNPDSMTLERLTPVAFKKARIELKRSLQAMNEVKKDIPYNYDLALTLAEIQLVTEIMILTSRLGQSLCTHGTRPFSGELGYQIVNVGVVNLPLTTRTDLANNLLEIRARFQHTWLSRNLPSTLPNSLKIFDNLFRTLLPPNMQEYGDNLL